MAGKFTDVLSGDHGSHLHGSVRVDSVSTHAPADAIIIPDADLLFNGDFKRSGVDLVLTGGDRELVLHDYFRGEKRAALASPDGAHLSGDLVKALTGHTQFAQADGSASVAPAVIGHVTKLAGNATAIRNGVSIILSQGDNVHKGDVVQSGSDSTLGITFIDGTVFGLASNARMVLNEMIYDPNGSDNKSLLSLVAGTISFVAGATAKKGDMKVDTPVATMGIRGTAVLVEIDFDVPVQGGAPPAKFQVLVEPDGTTGSYILYDKVTLTQIATVNRAGTQTIINGQGAVSFQSSVQLSPDAQKIISDVFSLKFSDLNNPNTKLTTNFTDTIVPETVFLKLASNDVVPVTLQFINIPDRPASGPSPGTEIRPDRIAGPPLASASGGAVAERTDVTADTTLSSVSGIVSYADINPQDRPSVSAQFSSFDYKDAQGANVSATLTAEQLAAIKAVEVPLVVVQDPNGKNTGNATWTYNIADGAFDFLASGETLTLTYLARVDTNYKPSNETTFVPFTIVITGTNDKPTLSATGGEITERIGTGNSVVDTVTGTVTFADVDLTDRPVVSAAISQTDPFRYFDAEGNDVTATLTAAQIAAIIAVAVPLNVAQAAGNTHNGSATWTYSVEDSKFDFIAKGETLTLNYVAQVDDGHGGVVSTPITVSIKGADVVVIGTNDVPTIDATSDGFAELASQTGSGEIRVAAGTISFTDVDLTDRPVASAAFSSFSYLNAYGVEVTSLLTGAQLAAISAVDEPLTVLQTSGNTNNGSASWSYSVPDDAFDFLADGEVLALTYAATVDDGHGGVVTKPITVTVTGSNDAVDITGEPQTATITEHADAHHSATPDTASGAITFVDADLSDTHNVKLAGVSASGVVTGLANGAVQLNWLSLGPLSDSTNGLPGSQSWTFSAPDSYFDYLADGETVTLTYTVEVDDHHGSSALQDIVVTVTGSNDAPVIGAIAQQNLTEQSGASALTSTIAVNFTDLDLSDVGHSASVTHAVASGATNGLALNEAALIALIKPEEVTKAAGSTSGSVELSFSAASSAFDYLEQGQVLTLKYTVAIDDGDGGVTSRDFVVTVTGTNDAPSIVGEVDPAPQTVIVAVPTALDVLDPGVLDNSLGLHTETFDQVTAGSASNNGTGHGNFYSEALGATFSASGHSGVVNGSSSGVTAAPYVGPAHGGQDTTNYLSIGSGSSETITFTSEKNSFGLYWGSLDSYNSIAFYDGDTIVAFYAGDQFSPLFPSGNTSSFSSNGYVQFAHLPLFDKVVLASGENAFEIDNISAGYVPEDIGLSGPVTGTLSVHDADVGDALTGVVVGNATFEYNGSTTIPGGIDISALLKATNVTFDIASSNGATVDLHWTYQPIDADFGFLHVGDVLEIKYVAEVSDGHGNAGAQELTITLVGADSPPDGSSNLMAGFVFAEVEQGAVVINGTPGDDVIHATSANDVLTGGAGADQFVFAPQAKSSSDIITDFTPGEDYIDLRLFSDVNPANIDHWLETNAAQSATNPNDVMITIGNDALTLKNIALSSLHASDFIVTPYQAGT
ncbi:VCBS domain-containing protein [Bradyrhizobium roseum]|uniref:VCBS domain-containing protein n=1 Tax=Bradyrhizobium roseum TaxID=3056648 RepID=UPI00260B0BC7|nr:VCBS domain-containing protein [Bradyrhizobium roseus]WKA28145.1 VCBS domain-containing protein [Bradyrhizobium roseus]